MGGHHGKEKKAAKASKVGDKTKDEYVKFIMREQQRREKEFKDRASNQDNIYN